MMHQPAEEREPYGEFSVNLHIGSRSARDLDGEEYVYYMLGAMAGMEVMAMMMDKADLEVYIKSVISAFPAIQIIGILENLKLSYTAEMYHSMMNHATPDIVMARVEYEAKKEGLI